MESTRSRPADVQRNYYCRCRQLLHRTGVILRLTGHAAALAKAVSHRGQWPERVFVHFSSLSAVRWAQVDLDYTICMPSYLTVLMVHLRLPWPWPDLEIFCCLGSLCICRKKQSGPGSMTAQEARKLFRTSTCAASGLPADVAMQPSGTTACD